VSKPLGRLQLWQTLLFAKWRWTMISVLWVLTAIQVVRGELPLEAQKQWYAAAFLPHWSISTWINLALAASLFSTLEAAFREIRKRDQTAIPIARTEASRAWLYTPLTEVYRRHFQNEEVALDGFNLIDCTFGSGVTLVYNGTAPFKMLNSQPVQGFVWKFRTDNLSIQHLLVVLKDMRQIGGGFEHNPSPLKRT
jgi:hypothetical protein